MALDDQLAALAAGELDDDTARALRARAAADPGLARRLARHEQLQRLLTGWDAPAMSEEGVGRLDARVEEALEALGEEPLAERPTPAARTPGPGTADGAAPGSDPAGVVDMGRARRRREESTSGGGTIAWPGWGAGAAVAAVLAAIVGTGVVLGGLPGGADLDMRADGEDSGAEVAQLESGDEALDDRADSGPAATTEEGVADDAEVTAEDSVRFGPRQREGVEVPEGELLTLVEVMETTAAQGSAPAGEGDEDTDDTAGELDDGGSDAAGGPGQRCVEQALQRDTSRADDRQVWLLAEGTYAGRDAEFVVVRTPRDGGEDRYEVLAYDPGDCSLLGRDATGR